MNKQLSIELTTNEVTIVADALQHYILNLFSKEDATNIDLLYALRVGEIKDKIERELRETA
jgi:hypothetical protein